MIYFDNAATTFPKPPGVVEAVTRYMLETGGNPGRSGHRLSVEAGNTVFGAREKLAKLFGVSSPMRVLFTSNATDALNTAIQGMLADGGHAVTTSMEHNSCVRPLDALKRQGRADYTIVSASPEGALDPDDVKKAIRPDTRLVAVNHGSNVFGTVQPVREIGLVCRGMGVPFLVDAAQTAGIIPIDMNADSIDLLALAGHKALYGPTGTGALILGDHFDFNRLRPLRYGGTGSNSSSIEQPSFLPDRFESGTLNAAGIAGLSAGIDYLVSIKESVEGVNAHKRMLVDRFFEGAGALSSCVLPVAADRICTGVVSFNLAGVSPSDVAMKLCDEFGIMCRAGLHCAPLAHKTMGTFHEGTVRFGFGVFNTVNEVDAAIEALAGIERAAR